MAFDKQSTARFQISLALRAGTLCSEELLQPYVVVLNVPRDLFYSFIYSFIYLIYLFLAALFLCCCARLSLVVQGLLFGAVCGLLIAVASLVAEHGL